MLKYFLLLFEKLARNKNVKNRIFRVFMKGNARSALIASA